MAKVEVRVKPGSKKGPLVVEEADGALTVHLRLAKAGGKANRAVVKALAHHLGVKKRRIAIAHGAKSKTKQVVIQSV